MVADPAGTITDALERLGQVNRTLVQRSATDAGLSALQVRVLTSLGAGARRPSQLARDLGVTAATLTDAVGALRAKGLVVDAPVGVDARVREVRLSPAGRRLVGRLGQWGMPVTRRIAALPEDDQGALLATLLDLLAGLQADGLVTARMCLSCRFYLPPRDRGGSAHCTLLDAPLEPRERRLECPDHEAIA